MNPEDADTSVRRRPRLLYAVTFHDAGRYLRGQLRYFRDRGYNVSLFAGPGPIAKEVARQEGATYHELAFERQLSPMRDLSVLVQIIRLLRRIRPDVVNAGTPKAGLLVTLAARLLGVPVVVYTLRGLRLETARGMTWALLWIVELVTCRMATHVICVSPALLARARELRLVSSRASAVGRGSSNGIDCNRFASTPDMRAAGLQLRAKIGISGASSVIGFVGRLNTSKGLVELAQAWAKIRGTRDARLLLVGRFDRVGEELPADIERQLLDDPYVTVLGEVDDPRPCFAAMDVFVLPSHREGSSNVVLEASAMGLPVVATRIPGCVDLIDDRKTGTLVTRGSVDELAEALCTYLDDVSLRRQHGQNASLLARTEFAHERIWSGVAELYDHLRAFAQPSERSEPRVTGSSNV